MNMESCEKTKPSESHPVDEEQFVVAIEEFVSYQCSCGFRLERVPRQVVAELSRCLGCGKAVRAGGNIRTSSFSSVNNLK